MTDFTAASALQPVGERRWRAHVPADWGQGRTTFGGLLAAVGSQAAAEVAGSRRPLRTLDVAFVAPVPAGPVEIEAEVLGEGKSTIQVQVSLYAAASAEGSDSGADSGAASGNGPGNGPGGRILGCRVFVVAGAPRVSRVVVEPGLAVLPPGDPGEQGLELPHVPGLSPAFIQNMELRWCSPALPFSSAGPQGALIDGWVRHRTRAEGLPALIALLDAWPPTVIPMFSTPHPSSSVRWAIHLVGADAQSRPRGSGFGTGKEWVWHQMRTVQAGDGYATTYASTYDADGYLLAWAEQLIAIYDKPSS